MKLDTLTSRKAKLYCSSMDNLASWLGVSRMTLHRALKGENTRVSEPIAAWVAAMDETIPKKAVRVIERVLQSQ